MDAQIYTWKYCLQVINVRDCILIRSGKKNPYVAKIAGIWQESGICMFVCGCVCMAICACVSNCIIHNPPLVGVNILWPNEPHQDEPKQKMDYIKQFVSRNNPFAKSSSGSQPELTMYWHC